MCFHCLQRDTALKKEREAQSSVREHALKLKMKFWFGHLNRMPRGDFPMDVFQARSTERRHWGKPKSCCKDIFSF